LANIRVLDRTFGPRAEGSDQEHMDDADQEQGNSAKEDEDSEDLEHFMSATGL